MKRRDFLSGLAAAMACGSRVLAESKRVKAPLASPPFYWGVGIENCWMAQTDPDCDGNRRLLDVFLQMQHYEKWKPDLDLAAEVGVNAIRYSVPWYKAEVREAPGRNSAAIANAVRQWRRTSRRTHVSLSCLPGLSGLNAA